MWKLEINKKRQYVITTFTVEYIPLSRLGIMSEHKQAENSDKTISFVSNLCQVKQRMIQITLPDHNDHIALPVS